MFWRDRLVRRIAENHGVRRRSGHGSVARPRRTRAARLRRAASPGAAAADGHVLESRRARGRTPDVGGESSNRPGPLGRGQRDERSSEEEPRRGPVLRPLRPPRHRIPAARPTRGPRGAPGRARRLRRFRPLGCGSALRRLVALLRRHVRRVLPSRRHDPVVRGDPDNPERALTGLVVLDGTLDRWSDGRPVDNTDRMRRNYTPAHVRAARRRELPPSSERAQSGRTGSPAS